MHPGSYFGRPGATSVLAFAPGGYNQRSYNITEWDVVGQSYIVLNVTEGQGSLEMSVVVIDQSANTNFSYKAPILDGIAPTVVSTAGGDNLTLSGSNLGIGENFRLSLSRFEYSDPEGHRRFVSSSRT